MKDILKRLAGETAVYGISSIVGRLLNWFLIPLYTRIFLPEEYGIVSYLLAYFSFLMIVLTYGLETGYFRFSSKAKNPDKVYSTILISLFTTSFLFTLIIYFFAEPINSLASFGYPVKYIKWLGITIAIDAFSSIPFARLRQKNKAFQFISIKLIDIGINVALNLFFLVLCKHLFEQNPNSWVTYIYNPKIGIGYIFISYLVSSLITLLLLSKEILSIKFYFDFKLLKQILNYSFPILIVGIASMINHNGDKILLPELIPQDKSPIEQLGIYSANYKIAVLMTLVVQAFRFSFEPFFFSYSKKENAKNVYADILKYFVIFILLIFLCISFNLNIVKYFVGEQYYSGLKIIPLILLGNLFFGVFSTLSLWYKLSDKTQYAAYISIGGAIITLALNIIFVPQFGYIASAWATLICFMCMAVISYILGQKFYPIPYNIKRILLYFTVAVLLFLISYFLLDKDSYILKNILIIPFLFILIYKEKISLKKLI